MTMASSSNLLKETLEVMNDYNLKPNHIDWIGSADGKYATFDWSEFESLANKVYNNRTVTYRVAHDLVIVFKNGQWFERQHDGIGSERWVVKTPPKYKSKVKNMKDIFGIDNDLETIHTSFLKSKNKK